MGNVRLRQVALAALNGAKVIHQLGATLGLSTGYEDPAVAVFGLENRVFALGDQFLEIVSPVTDTAPVLRFLKKTGRRSAGYMVILGVDSVVPYRERAEALDCRVMVESESETWSTLTFTPTTWAPSYRLTKTRVAIGFPRALIGGSGPKPMSLRVSLG